MNLIIENKLTYVIWKTNQKWKTLCLFDAGEYTMANEICAKNGMFSKHTWAYLYLYFLFFHILANELIVCLFLLVSNMVSTFKHTTLYALLSFLTKKTFWNNIFALYFHLLHFSILFLVSNVQSQNDHCTYLKRKILNHNWF